MMYMVNTNSGSRFRLNPCDFALYDQDDDLAVTMTDFDILFSEMEERGHILVEQLFMEFDVDNGKNYSEGTYLNYKRTNTLIQTIIVPWYTNITFVSVCNNVDKK